MLNMKGLDSLLLVVYCAFIFWLSAQPNLKPPIDFQFLNQDKLYHAGAYFLMAIFAWRCFRHIFKYAHSVLWFSIMFCSFYGISDEWQQSFIPGRSVSVLDWLADTLGAALLALVWDEGFPLRLQRIFQQS